MTVLAGLAGFAVGAASPIANGQFVQALPNAFRARAFGVVQGGLQVLQGGAVLMTGLLAADHTRIPFVVGVWSLFGVVLLVLGLSLAWPAPRAFTDAVAAAPPRTLKPRRSRRPAPPADAAATRSGGPAHPQRGRDGHAAAGAAGGPGCRPGRTPIASDPPVTGAARVARGGRRGWHDGSVTDAQ